MSEAASKLTAVPRRNFGFSLFAGLACLMDILLLRGWLLGHLAMIEALALHSCLAVGLGAVFMLLHRRILQSIFVWVILLILFGPLGGPALMIAAPATPGPRPEKARRTPASEARAAHAGSADDLFERIMQGRRHPLPQSPPCSFLKTFTAGSLQQQQEAIAAMCRAYHPDMRPALAAALASPTPAVRVQAAAVFAKLRGTYESRARELLALDNTGTLASGRGLVDECLAVARSGFVDPETRSLLEELSNQLSEQAAPAVTTPGRTPARPRPRPALQPAPRLKRYACGGVG